MSKLALMISCASLLVAVAIAAHGTPAGAVVASSDDLAWTDVKGRDGSLMNLRTVDLWGQAAKGAHGSLTKFPASLAEPLHTHSRDLRVVVIAGRMAFSIDGSETKELGPGSFVSIPAGIRHAAICRPASPCEVFLEQSGAMDVKLVEKHSE
jgi:quercetin dioxygenase-like cupin family protein